MRKFKALGLGAFGGKILVLGAMLSLEIGFCACVQKIAKCIESMQDNAKKH